MKRARGAFVAVVAVLVCAVGIAAVQPRLAHAVRRAKSDDRTYLPPPNQLRAMAFGYRAAGADLLWAKLLVEHGTRWAERRDFPEMPAYFDGILALDPGHPTLYRFLATLVMFTAVGGTETDARLVRRYLEQGTKQRPYDPELWLEYGQFLAYLAPSYLKDEGEIDAWRRDGALAITHAVDLGADAERAMSATTILTKAGERKAAIVQLQRTYAVTDDPALRYEITLKLQKLEADTEAERATETVEHEWRSRLPFLSRSASLLLGPYRDPAACAGPDSYSRRQCPRDWTTAVAP